MAGHSKWANIKHRKGAQDAARAKEFAKLSKEIMVAAANGGSDINSNSSLRLAISKARARSMPKKNIESAINKATGSSEGANFKEIQYGGNVAGVSFLVTCLSDNANRVASNVQSYFNKANGSVSSASSVSYIFKRKGVLEFDKNDLDEEETMLLSIESGAEDFESDEEIFTIYTNPSDLTKVKETLEKNNITEFKLAEVMFIPENKIKLPQDKSERILKFLERVENDEDVQEVYHNLDLSSIA